MPVTIRRRELIAAIGGAALWPLAARAQKAGKIYRIGFLANDPTIPEQPAGQAFLDGLRESGFVEGKNIIIERRFAEGRVDQYAPLVAELMRLGVNVIVTSANDATLAAKQANTKIPIVIHARHPDHCRDRLPGIACRQFVRPVCTRRHAGTDPNAVARRHGRGARVA